MSVKAISQVVLTTIALVCVVIFIGGFFYTIFRAAEWECKEEISVKVRWMDSEEVPEPRYTTQSICVHYER